MIVTLQTSSKPWMKRTFDRPSRFLVRASYSSEEIKPCVKCRHSRVGCVQPYDREPRIECSLFVDYINPVTGEKKYKSAIEMRRKGNQDPGACALEGRLYQARDDDLEIAQFNMFWFAAWTQCMQQKQK